MMAADRGNRLRAKWSAGRALAWGTAVLTLAACEGKTPQPTAPEPLPVSTVVLAFNSATVSMGATRPLSPVFRDADGTVVPGRTAPVWSSSHPAIASADATGLVRAHALGGPVTISVTVDGVSASATVTVVPDRLGISPDTTLVLRGGALQLSAQYLDFGGAVIQGATPQVTWTSSDANIATVDAATGLVTGVADGLVFISGEAGGFTAGRTFIVGAPSSLDGRWIANYTVGSRPVAIEMRIGYGVVRQFRLTFDVTSAGTSCERTDGTAFAQIVLDGTPFTPVTNAAFSFPAPGALTVTVVGTFTGPESLSVQHGEFAFGTFPCRPSGGGGISQVVAIIPSTTVVATRAQ